MRHIPFWQLWLLATFFGGLLGSTVAYGLGFVLMHTIFTRLSYASLLAFFILPLVVAIVTGIITAIWPVAVLHADPSIAQAWWKSSLIGWAITGILFFPSFGMLTDEDMRLFGPFVLAGTLIAAIAQALMLRSHSAHWLWLTSTATAASTIGWVIALSLLGHMRGGDPFIFLQSMLYDRALIRSREIVNVHVVDGQMLFFVLVHGNTTKWELWRSDGTAQGSELIGHDDPDTPFYKLGNQLVAGHRLLFRVLPEQFPPRGTGDGGILWQSDGSRQGTQPLSLPHMPGENPHLWAGSARGLYYAKSRDQDCTLWWSATDSTELTPLQTFPGSCIWQVQMLHEIFFFVQMTEISNEKTDCIIWAHTGQNDPIRQVAHYPATQGGTCMEAAQVSGDTLIWKTSLHAQTTIWVSRGTPETTHQLGVVNPQNWAQIPTATTLHPAQSLFFTAFDAELTSCAHFVADSGTERIQRSGLSCTDFFIPTASYMLLLRANNVQELQLVSIDSSKQEFVLLDNISEGERLEAVDVLGLSGDTAYLKLKHGQRCTIVQTNGTPDGTQRLQMSCPEHLTRVQDGYLFFYKESGRSYGLWKLQDGSDTAKRIRSIP